MAKAPVSAPTPSFEETDLLDLNFTQEPTPAPAPAPQQHDLFEFLVADKLQTQPTSAKDSGTGSVSSTEEILSLYKNNNQAAMATFGTNHNAFYPQQPNNGMAMMTNMMGQMNMQPQPAVNQQQMMMMYQQQQQQQMLLMQQQQMMMQQQNPNPMMMMPQQPGMMMNNNNMMMMMNPHSNNMGGMAPMGTGPPVSSFQPQYQQTGDKRKPSSPKKEDPFAQFGVNVFRS